MVTVDVEVRRQQAITHIPAMIVAHVEDAIVDVLMGITPRMMLDVILDVAVEWGLDVVMLVSPHTLQ